VSKEPADPFAQVHKATDAHRARHRCHAYPYRRGPLLGALAAAVQARRVLELGAALGYTALCFAHGAPDARVDTVERDADHVTLARKHVAAAGLDRRVAVHEGDFFDGHTPVPALHVSLGKLLRPGGLLITANLNHGGTANTVAQALFDGRSWCSALVDDDGETAISVKL
jgi:predicted O-methyltransferase YrrM